MNKSKSYEYNEQYEINLRSENALKKRMRISQSENSAMSTKTKDFIQKICYKKTASVDMTQYGFVNDSKLNPVNLMMRPLIAQLEKICGKSSKDAYLASLQAAKKEKSKPGMKASLALQPPRKVYSSGPRGRGSTTENRQNSARSNPGTRSPNPRLRKVKIQSQSNPKTEKNKVNMVLPPTNNKKK